ncbi:MAG: DUF86 domain-containing protein [Bryobacterales bacterium]|nr:DUF86 domain-containing protein [Bryobacterales bacterium]
MKEGRVYLAHMLERVDRILKYIEPGREAFMSDEQIQDSVIRNLEIIGEAAKRVPPELRTALPNIDWAAIGAMRNILAHDYVDVDLEEVWNATAQDVPILRERLREFLRQS